MSLQFILGAAGSGKTGLLYRQLIEESAAHPEKNYILLVPEQFSMQTQRRIVQLHPKKGILNIDVLSFPRLAYRVFQEAGTGREQVLTETGKNLILRRVAGQVRGQLKLLGGRMDRQGYVEEVKSLLSEFAQYEISDVQLSQMIEESESRSLLAAKLEDIQILSRAFAAYKEEKYITGEEILGVFAREVPSSALLRGAVLALDGFTGFTPVQITALRALLRVCDKIRIALTIPEGEELFRTPREEELFYLSKKTIRDLTLAAKEEHALLLDPVYAGTGEGQEKGGRFALGSGLARLERRLMRYEPQETSAPCEDGDIQLISCKDPVSELTWTASKIRDLVREGYRYREIAVIAGDLDAYAHHAERIFEVCGIPYFIDHKIGVDLNPCLEVIRALLEIAQKGYSYEGIMRLLRTGYVLSVEETDLLEQYLLAAGIRGRKRWETPWERVTKRFREEDLPKLNQLRTRIAGLLAPLMDRLGRSPATARTYGETLLEALELLQVEEKLRQDRVKFEDEAGSPMLLSAGERQVKAMEYDQVYEVAREVLEEAIRLLGEEKISRKEFIHVLEAGFSEARVGLIPPALDQVYVGDLERTRLSQIRILFFVGMNDGWIPARKEKAGLLSEYDREFLEEKSFVLAPGLRRSMYTQRFYLYQVLTKPSDRLFISCSESDMSGAPLRPSYVINEIRGIFPGKKLCRGEQPLPASLRSGAPLLARQLRMAAEQGKASNSLRELMRAYLSSPAYAQSARRLCAFCGAEKKAALTPEIADALYGETLYGSVSRIDSFAQCPFEHFAQYGLRLMEREELRIRPTDTGTLLHDALRLFFEEVKENRRWREISEREQEELAHACMERAAEGFGNGLFFDSARNRYTLERAEQIMQTAVRGLMLQLQAGSFAPEGLELSFDTGDDPDGTAALRLVGQIDRLDAAKEGEKRYLKIIDYKSGTTSFDLGAIYDGRQLQLPVYLHQALTLAREKYPGEEIVPAGLFYCHLEDPLIMADPASLARAPEETAQKAAGQLLKRLKPDGLANAAPEIMLLYAEDEKVRELVVPVPVYSAKTGELREDSMVADTGRLETMDRYVQGKLVEYTERILDGEIAPYPYREKERAVCEYCSYRSVCGFEERTAGSAYREKTRMDPGQLWLRMTAEAGAAKESRGENQAETGTEMPEEKQSEAGDETSRENQDEAGREAVKENVDGETVDR